MVNLEAQPYSYLHALADSEILYMIIQAERDGFDGVVIACYHDPSLLAARQAVDIPVVGFGESSMLLALTMGRKFGLFCPSPLGVPDFEDRVAQYGHGRPVRRRGARVSVRRRNRKAAWSTPMPSSRSSPPSPGS